MSGIIAAPKQPKVKEKISILGWPGYEPLFEALRNVDPCDLDKAWWLEEEFRDDLYCDSEDHVIPAEHADDLLIRVQDESTSTPDFVVVDREYKQQYLTHLLQLSELNIYPDRMLHSALPLLAARQYYAISNKGSFLVPVRFGTNGIVCNQPAIQILRGAKIIAEEDGCLEKFYLDRLYQQWQNQEDKKVLQKIEFCRWGWDSPVEKILTLASGYMHMTVESATKFKTTMKQDVFCTANHSWKDMRLNLLKPTAVATIGPSEMLAAPIKYHDGEELVDWFLVKGAGLLWVETLGCAEISAGSAFETKRTVINKRRNWLVGVVLRLMCDPWTAVSQGDYWGYPVLGWTFCGGDQGKKKIAIENITRMVGKKRALGLNRQDPGEWMSKFLMQNGIALREIGPRRGTVGGH